MDPADVKKQSQAGDEPDLEKSFKNFTEAIDHIQDAYDTLFQQIQEANQNSEVAKEGLEEMAGNLAHGIRNHWAALPISFPYCLKFPRRACGAFPK